MWTEHRFLSFDETPVFYRRLHHSSRRASVLIVHGMGEHGGRYREFAEYLGSIGCEVWVPDLRGFGDSGGRRASLRRFSDYHRDLTALAALARREAGEKPFFLIGHSLGGLIASSWLAFGGGAASGLVLSSPLFGIEVAVPSWRRRLGMAASRISPDYRQATSVDPRLLTHDTAILEAYSKDPRIDHRISARLYTELSATLARADEIASSVRTPALVVQAGFDAIVSLSATRRFFAALASTDKELEIYEGLYHEILNETSRSEIYSRIGAWLTKRLSR